MRLPDEGDQRKLEGIIARLASDHDGERAAAGLLLTRLLKKHGKTPQDLVNGGGSSSSGHDAANAIYWRAQHGLVVNQLRAKEKTLRLVEQQRNDALHKANRIEQEAMTLRSQLGAAQRELAKLRAQAKPEAYQSPPWDEDADHAEAERLRREAKANADAFHRARAKAQPRDGWDDTGPGPAWEDGRTYPNAAAEANALLRSGASWSAWERSFLESLTAWRGSPSANQARVLEELRAKARQWKAAQAAQAGLW